MGWMDKVGGLLKQYTSGSGAALLRPPMYTRISIKWRKQLPPAPSPKV